VYQYYQVLTASWLKAAEQSVGPSTQNMAEKTGFWLAVETVLRKD
jgi:hypothetical protein